MAKSKRHQFVITLSFDKPCTAAHALAEAKDCFHGNFYPTQHDDRDPGEGWIKGIRRLRVKREG
jgi:hypothetical protein